MTPRAAVGKPAVSAFEGFRRTRSGALRGGGQGRRQSGPPTPPRGAAARLAEAERLFEDFRALTPYRFRPFTRSFATFAEYERWRRAQTNPWYR
jgi:hypothetical protein